MTVDVLFKTKVITDSYHTVVSEEDYTLRPPEDVNGLLNVLLFTYRW